MTDNSGMMIVIRKRWTEVRHNSTWQRSAIKISHATKNGAEDERHFFHRWCLIFRVPKV